MVMSMRMLVEHQFTYHVEFGLSVQVVRSQ